VLGFDTNTGDRSLLYEHALREITNFTLDGRRALKTLLAANKRLKTPAGWL
jgi:hypothetical protein